MGDRNTGDDFLSPTTRREFLKDAALAGVAISTSNLYAQTATKAAGTGSGGVVRPVELRLLDKDAATPTGISWGVPWPQGAVSRTASFQLNSQQGSLPLQSWPLAYWPDGSMKWSGFATALPAGFEGSVTLSPGKAGSAAGAVSVTRNGKAVVVDTGALRCEIPVAGTNLIGSISVGGKEVANGGQLVCILQSGAA